LISGVGITHLGFPPYLGSLASISPIVLDTDSLPGKTLWGPIIIWRPVGFSGDGSGT